MTCTPPNASCTWTRPLRRPPTTPGDGRSSPKRERIHRWAIPPPTKSARVPTLALRGGGPAPYAPPEVDGGDGGDNGGGIVDEVDDEEVEEVGDREGDHTEEGGLGAGRREVGVKGEGECAE